jgi:hypothetical protein
LYLQSLFDRQTTGERLARNIALNLSERLRSATLSWQASAA